MNKENLNEELEKIISTVLQSRAIKPDSGQALEFTLGNKTIYVPVTPQAGMCLGMTTLEREDLQDYVLIKNVAIVTKEQASEMGLSGRAYSPPPHGLNVRKYKPKPSSIEEPAF